MNAPIREWIIWEGRFIKKFKEIVYVEPFQRHSKRKRIKNLSKDMANSDLDKQNIKMIKKHHKKS